MKNIVLTGMPGVGKSTVGVILAKLLGMEFTDTDLVIQKEEGRLLSKILEEKGIAGFLETENRICASLTAENTVIATGGSVVYGEEAMAHLKEIGEVVYLKLPYAVIRRRLHNIKDRGVVLKEGQTLKSLYDERVPLYEKYADLIIEEEGLDIEETVAAIREALTEKKR